MEADYTMDDKGNMKAGAKMCRFLVRDKQVALKDGSYQSIISSNFQNIIGNKEIEEVCSKLDTITDYEERINQMKKVLQENKLSQLEFTLNLNKNQNTDIFFKFSEFHVIFAAQTVASLAQTLAQVNYIQNNLLPKLLVKNDNPKPAPPVEEPPPVKDTNAISSAGEYLGEKTILKFQGELSDIVFMLPKTGLKNNEKVAKFSLTTKVNVNMEKTKEESSMKVDARVEEICLDIIKEEKILSSLIKKTKIVFVMSDESQVATKTQKRQITTSIDPINIHLSFSSLGFFANASAGILANLPSLQQASQAPSDEIIKEKAAKPKEVVPEPEAYKVTTCLNAELELIEFIIFDDSIDKNRKYPWVSLYMKKTGGEITMESFEDKQSMKGRTGIGEFKGVIKKKLVGV